MRISNIHNARDKGAGAQRRNSKEPKNSLEADAPGRKIQLRPRQMDSPSPRGRRSAETELEWRKK